MAQHFRRSFRACPAPPLLQEVKERLSAAKDGVARARRSIAAKRAALEDVAGKRK